MKREKILEQMNEIKREMASSDLCKGTADVYTRISGYYRSVGAFNDGKVGEYNDRKEYNISKA